MPTNASTSTNQSQIVINNNNVHSPVKVFAPYNDDFSKVVIKDREVIFKPSPHPDLT
ncbi:MAG: hypothetical protein ACXV2A_05615 [Halobacteriota archaeon]